MRIFLIICLMIPSLTWAGWEFVEPMPTAREGLAVVELDDKIYAIGGRNQNNFMALDVVEIFDPGSCTWSIGPALNNPRIYSAAAVHDGRIFVFGGRAGFWLVDEIEMYDPEVGYWEEIGWMYSREGLSADTYGDSIIIVGGKTVLWSYSPYADVYDPINLEWSGALPNYPVPRAGHGSLVLGDSLFIIGGVGFGILSDVSIFNGIEWISGTDLPFELGNTGAAKVGKDIFVVGGNNGLRTSNSTLFYSFSDNHWIEIDTLNTDREYHGVVACNEKLYAIGGGQGSYFDRDYLDSVELLDLTTKIDHPAENITDPELFSIANYPNPFTDFTDISITAPVIRKANQPVVIYNVIGREVMRWKNPNWQNSQLNFQWNGSDLYGIPLPTGIYFIRINVNDATLTQKISIIR